MADPDYHGPPGVEYTPPTEDELRHGAVIVRDLPSVSLIAESTELEELFYEHAAAIEYRNEVAREIHAATDTILELRAEMRAIDFRAGPEEKAAYNAMRDEVRAEHSRLYRWGGVMRTLNDEKTRSRIAMLEIGARRHALQRQVRMALRDARMAR